MSNFPITPIAITMGDPSGIGPEIIVMHSIRVFTPPIPVISAPVSGVLKATGVLTG